MFLDLEAERARGIQRLRRHFRSTGYSERVNELENELLHAVIEPGPRAELNAAPVVQRQLELRYQRMLKAGAVLDCNQSEITVGELENECRELLDLLGSFEAILKPDALRGIIKRLHRLQTAINDFCDFQRLENYAVAYLDQAKRLDRSASAALGGLVAILNDRKSEACRTVAKRLTSLGNDKMKLRFENLF